MKRQTTIWIRRKDSDMEHCPNVPGTRMSWKVYTSDFETRKDHIPCSVYILRNGTVVTSGSSVNPHNLVECTEWEAFNYWKKEEIYEIY